MHGRRIIVDSNADVVASTNKPLPCRCPQAFKKLVTDKAELDGVPASALALFAQQAKAAGNEAATAEDGPWLLTLDFPSYLPIQRHAKNRALRAEIYRRYSDPACLPACLSCGFLVSSRGEFSEAGHS